MNNSIRWLLTETKIFNLDTNTVNFNSSTNKLICYHLTSHKKWAQYNERISDQLNNPTKELEEKPITGDETRAQRILKSLYNKNRKVTITKSNIEEEAITDIMGDPYTDTSGFKPGGGEYHGKGLYTCYKFNPSIASTYGNICLVFEIDISNFLILSEDLAKQVHGENWRIKDQLLKLFFLNNSEETFKKNISAYKEMLEDLDVDSFEMNKIIDQKYPLATAKISKSIVEKFSKDNIVNLYDGVVLFGGSDGPVCASFLPQHDAKLIGLGRLNKKRPEVVDWYDSLNDFVGGNARNKLDFETMNSIAEENMSVEEKAIQKLKLRGEINLNYINIYKKILSSKPTEALDLLQSFDQEERLEVLKYLASKLLVHQSDFYRNQLWGRGGIISIYNILSLIISNVSISNEDRKNITKFLAYNYTRIPYTIITDEFINEAILGFRELFEDRIQCKGTLFNFYADCFRHIFRTTRLDQSLEDKFNKVLEDYSWINVVDQGDLGRAIKEYGKSDDSIKEKIIAHCHRSTHVFIDSSILFYKNKNIEKEFKVASNDFLEKSLDFVNYMNMISIKEKVLNNFIILCKNSNYNIEFRESIIEELVSIFETSYKNYSVEELIKTQAFSFISVFLKYSENFTVKKELLDYLKNLKKTFLNSDRFKKVYDKIIDNTIEVRKYNRFLSATLEARWQADRTFDICKIILLEMSLEEKNIFFNEVINSKVFQYTTNDNLNAIVKKIEVFKIELTDESIKILIDKLYSGIPPTLGGELERTISRSNITKDNYRYGLEKLLSSTSNKNYVEDALAYSINLYKMMLKNDDIIELIANISSFRLANIIVMVLRKSFSADVILKNSPHNLILNQEKLTDIISNDNIAFYERFISIYRNSINGHSYETGISNLEKLVKTTDSGNEESSLDLSHRILIGKTLKEIYNIKN